MAGSKGDFGTLFPLAAGFIVECELDPAGLFIWIGLVNIATGLIYRLPMPVEPKKVVAVAAMRCHTTQLGSSPMMRAPAEKQRLFFETEYCVPAAQRRAEADFLETIFKT
jgi:hypothetical protein